jgi:hypothetical protein
MAALLEDERRSRRLSTLLVGTSAAMAAVLILLGIWFRERISLAALALGYAAVCSWLAAAFTGAYARFARQKLEERVAELEIAEIERQRHGDDLQYPRRSTELIEDLSYDRLERATNEASRVARQPVRLAGWVAGLAAALTLAAVGFVTVPSAHGVTKSGPRKASSNSTAILGISWAVEDPLFVQTPSSFHAPPGTARVALRVVDPMRPDCASRYGWQVTSDNGVPVPVQVGDRGTCGVVAHLVPEDQYRVHVTREAPSRGDASGEAQVRVGDLLVASFGDSVASGEGNPARKPKWADDSGCNRSFIAGPRQAAQLMAAASAHSRVVLFHLACTGAWIDGVGAPDAFGSHPSVLPQFGDKRHSQTEIFAERYGAGDGRMIVLLTVGANDVGFGPIVRFCLKTFSKRCFENKLPGTKVSLDELVRRRLSELPAAYQRLAQSRPFSGSPVFVSEYFDPLHNQKNKLCRVALGRRRIGMSIEEAAWADESILRPLNAIVEDQAAAHKWVYVGGVSNAFRTHGYCARPDSWIVHIVRAFLRRNTNGIFHPNDLGQGAYGRLIFQAVKPYLPP